MRKYLLLILLFTIGSASFGQSSPKREMRSGWLATVWSIDWPGVKLRETGDEPRIKLQKEQMISTLDKMKSANVNSVFFQVRSRCDAMYKSSFEPWSSDLIETRGTEPGYDPLAFVIEEAHKRGMEVHTWLNPYRYESQAGQWSGVNDYRNTHPEWLLQIGDAVILNPGLPEVRQRISDIVAEIVTNYDIDGIVFDDYFYLQGISNQDAKEYQAYNPDNLPIKDWRRENVNMMISDVYDRIKSIKPYVEFGVSPAGIWDGGATVAKEKYGVKLPVGVSSGGYQYNGIYSDPLAWMKAKTIDYISPQIYWPTTHTTAPYKPLSDWWSYLANFFGVQFYSSHSLSEISGIPVPTKSTPINDEDLESTYGSMSQLEKLLIMESRKVSLRATNTVASDYLQQVRSNREYDLNGAPGSVFYSVKSLIKTFLPEYLKANVFQNPALRPALWTSEGKEEFVSNIRVNGGAIEWDYSGEYPKFTVYAIPNAEVNKIGNFSKSDYLVDVSYATSIEIPSDKPVSDYTYAVAVFDRFNNEYSPKIIGKEAVATGSAPTLEYPLNNGQIVFPDALRWTTSADAEYYVVEVAKDLAFTDILYKREVSNAHLAGECLTMLRTGEDYYWRVTTRRVSTKDATSSVFKFTPAKFSVITPTSDVETTITPTITWTNLLGATNYKVEISTNASNFDLGIVYSKETTESSCIVDEGVLAYSTKYYLRVSVLLNTGSTGVTETVDFTTLEVLPPTPIITTPLDGDNIGGTSVVVEWEGSEYASRYEIACSTKPSFPSRETTIKFTPALTYETEFTGLKIETNYYLRVRALYGSKVTEWSDVVSVLMSLSSLGEEQSENQCYVYFEGDMPYLIINRCENNPISVILYDISGTKVKNIVNNYMPVGENEKLSLSSFRDLPKGVYILNVDLGENIVNIKLMK